MKVAAGEYYPQHRDSDYHCPGVDLHLQLFLFTSFSLCCRISSSYLL